MTIAEIRNRAEELVRWWDYSDSRPALFVSRDSFRWWMRQHKSRLVEAGALTRPTGDWMIDPEIADRVAVEIGAERAAKA